MIVITALPELKPKKWNNGKHDKLIMFSCFYCPFAKKKDKKTTKCLVDFYTFDDAWMIVILRDMHVVCI